MGISFGVIGEMPPWCLIYECCKKKQSASFLIFLRILPHPRHLRDLAGSLYYGVQWNIKLFFMYKLLYNHFCCSIPVSFNCDFHDYYTRSRNDIRKSSATRRWGHWSSVNFNSNIWNCVDTSLREAETLSSFKCGLSKAILWYVYVHLYVFNQIYMCMWIIFFIYFSFHSLAFFD